ncbi:hypothetical protein CN231_24975 [Sinorhizobium meliloti]|nr:hypothetical protein CN231_24975 [Sinorhizobium meliloti]
MVALRQIAFHGKGIGMSKQKRRPKPKPKRVRCPSLRRNQARPMSRHHLALSHRWELGRP